MEHTLKFTDQQLRVIGDGLAELPFKFAQPVFVAIQEQLDAADQARKQEQEGGGSKPGADAQ